MFDLFRKPEPIKFSWERSSKNEKKIWSLDDELLVLSSGDQVTISDVLRGVQVFGSTGSGKTSGSGRALALSYLRNGFGGIVLCVKNDEVELWEKYAREAQREEDLVIVDAKGSVRFNFIKAEVEGLQGVSVTQNLVRLILDIHRVYSREDGGKNQDPFWQNQLQTTLTHAINIARVKGDLSMRGILKVIRKSVDFSEQSGSGSFVIGEDDYVSELNELMNENPNDRSIGDAVDFFLNEFKSMADKTRSIVVAMIRSVGEPLMQEPMEDIFCTTTTHSPKDTFDGKIFVINIPVHAYRSIGMLSQLIWKNLFFNEVRRRVKPNRPVFLWADESQFFAEENDIQFLTTSRSLRCATNYLTQNIANYQTFIGRDEKVKALLGSLNLKIFHQNADPSTNKFASDVIGKIPTKKTSVSSSKKGDGDLLDAFLPGRKPTFSTSIQYETDVPERVYTNLKEGGRSNGLIVEGIVHIPGRRLSSGKTWVKAKFSQI